MHTYIFTSDGQEVFCTCRFVVYGFKNLYHGLLTVILFLVVFVFIDIMLLSYQNVILKCLLFIRTINRVTKT